MVDISLVNYIKEHLQQGYDIQTIRAFLIKNGYPPHEVQGAIQYLQAHQQRQGAGSQQKMLVTYVKQYLKQGYSPQQIQASLLQRGYPPFVVQQAVKQATKKGIGLPHISGKVVLVLFCIILVLGAVAGIGWFFVNTEWGEEVVVDYDVRLDITTVEAGGTLYIANDFIDFPEKRKEDVTLYYSIADMMSITQDSWQETFRPDDPFIRNTQHMVPRRLEPGEYQLIGEMKYGEQTVRRWDHFDVVAEDIVPIEPTTPTPSVPEPSIPDDEPDDTDEDVVLQSEPGVISENDFELYAQAKLLSETDPVGAAVVCEDIQNAGKKDDCYVAVGRNSNDMTVCAQIVADIDRDGCYIDFAFNKEDYSACEFIGNNFLRTNCGHLAKVAELQEAQTGLS